MRRLAVLFLALLPVAAHAESPVTIEEFEQIVTGKVMLHLSPGSDTPYGTEEYLPGRKVRWAFTADSCIDGTYYEENGYICFAYEDAAYSKECWLYFRDGADLTALPYDIPPDSPRYTLQTGSERLPCMGPDVGV